MQTARLLWTAVLFCACAACGDSTGTSPDAGSSTNDSGSALDASAPDAAGPHEEDASEREDSATPDPVECRRASDCQAPNDLRPCTTIACVDNQCVLASLPENLEFGEQVASDCRTAVCDGDGNVASVEDDDDVASDDAQCTRDACSAGSAVHPDETAGTVCTQDGGRVCDGQGACVECAWPSDCESDVCQGGQCRQPLCGNDELDDGEADVDCGGDCGACGPERACSNDLDCVGLECDLNLCVPNCEDGVQNNTESDRDCGAVCGGSCDEGEQCLLDDDCQSGFCHPAIHECATPSCSDLFMNGTETGEDCGGGCPACPLACLWNEHCTPGEVCYLEFCAPSVNGCTFATATNLRNMPSVMVELGGAHGNAFEPRCMIVTMNSEVTFNGDFATHPLVGGHVRLGTKYPVSSGPFVPMTNTGLSKTVTMSECNTFGFYSDTEALSGMTGTIFVVAP